MTVIVLTNCPIGLRGQLTRWMLEISPGVYVGRPNIRVRDKLWSMIIEMIKNGRAIMVEHAANEQGFKFRVHHNDWEPVDVDGLQLIRRPVTQSKSRMKPGWSKASQYRRAKRINK